MAQADQLETYASQYFTGTQASMWIGDIWVDEVFGIQISASQSVLPIFGYASSFFDAIARGKVLVHGAFEINFVDEGYLYAVLMEHHRRRAGIPQAGGPPRYESKVAGPYGIMVDPEPGVSVSYTDEPVKRTGAYGAFGVWSEEFYRNPAEERGTTGEGARRGSGRSNHQVIIEQLQVLKEITEGNSPDGRSRRLAMNEILNQIAQLDMIGLDRMVDKLNAKNEPAPPQNVIYEMVPFTLKGYFGNPELYGSDQGTFKEIQECFLVGNEMIIGNSDEVVKERYSFIARRHI